MIQRRLIVHLIVLMLVSNLANAQTPSTELPASAAPQIPTVTLRPAPLLRLPSALDPETGEEQGVDCNSPVEWDAAGNMIVFTSVRHPARSLGRDLFNLQSPGTPVTIEPREDVSGGQWLESTFRDADGVLYGWYHNEPPPMCDDQHLSAPRIGQMISRDDGATWQDQGIILEAPQDSLDCDTENFYFAGGNGDFTVMLDRDRQYFYFLFSSYHQQLEEQGISIARMRYDARNNPADNVWKWSQGEWTEPGLGGRLTPVFPATSDWHGDAPDAFWGPAIHFNTQLGQYVMLLNRAIDSRWSQEGVYVSFNRNLDNPLGWSAPQRLPFDPLLQAYPQVIGTAPGETDKLAGRVARFFLLGQSIWEIVFDFQQETLPFTAPPRISR
jgi:hypothetical protein